MLRELILGGSETLFAKVVRRGARAACGSNLRGVEEVANEGHGVRRKLFDTTTSNPKSIQIPSRTASAANASGFLLVGVARGAHY